MEYKKCFIYGLKSKKKLMELLYIKRKVYCKSSFINTKIKPYIENKKRLIEAPDSDIKAIQSIILKWLQKIIVPNHVFSGIKGKSFVDNAKMHCGKDYIFKIDVSKFFPNITREKVYNFFKRKLNMSPDVANILTNLSTVNLDDLNKNTNRMIKVNNFIVDKEIKTRNHLITGSPLSCILSYFANEDMFYELQVIAEKNEMVISIYIDDVVFSSNKKIFLVARNEILNTIKNRGYKISKTKCKYYKQGYVKKITGVIIDKNNNPQIPNRLILKTHNFIDEFKQGNFKNIDKLKGCLVVSKEINGKFKALSGKIKQGNIITEKKAKL